MKRLLLSVGLSVATSFALVGACSDQALDSYCTNIPTGGCPSDDPSTCIHDAGPDASPGDPTCAAIYTHSPDCTWSLVQTCPNYQPPHDAAPDVGRDAPDAGADVTLRDAGFPLPDGASGGSDACVGLQAPDCPLAGALACGASCCGCATLYVCGNGGWTAWGECVDGGVIEKQGP